MAWSNQSRSAASWIDGSKNSTIFTDGTKRADDFDTGIAYLLTELTEYLCQENGGRLILSQSTNHEPDNDWADGSKSSASWTDETKH